jgi:hypothetical protein
MRAGEVLDCERNLVRAFERQMVMGTRKRNQCDVCIFLPRSGSRISQHDPTFAGPN